MKFTVLTLFPEMFSPLKESMTGRAEKKGILDFDIVNIRDFSLDKHQKTDDTPFGGGHGMVMMPEPLFGALRSVGLTPDDACADGESGKAGDGFDDGTREAKRKRLIYMSPRGKMLDKDLITELSEEDEIVILAGHYEGVDQRVLDAFHAEEVSIGDYVLTGGELPAMVLIDSVSRMIPGVIAKEEAILEESIYSGLLEYPQYTQPRSFEGHDVPEVLLNGDHEKIRKWKLEKALELTREKRPDLYARYIETKDDGGK